MTAMAWFHACETCRYFGCTESEWTEEHDDAGVMDEQGRLWNQCGFILHRSAEHGWHSSKAYVKDASDYWAGLYVAQDFGCVEWKEKL